MYLDLHSHSVSSDDSRATVEQYVKWIQVLRNKRGYTVDGFVLTEHRKFDFDKDYSQLAAEYDVLILKGSELDTRYGHFLVYGVTDALASEIDLADVKLDARELMKAARHHGAIAIPAHPGRFGIGLVDYMEQGETFADVNIVERLNGGSRAGENERADVLCQEQNYLGTGGSDAHLASHLGACLTSFPQTINTERDLVEALLSGDFTPVWLKDTANN
jgi:predicted metal-dependent phosphoesterase TrpH